MLLSIFSQWLHARCWWFLIVAHLCALEPLPDPLHCQVLSLPCGSWRNSYWGSCSPLFSVEMGKRWDACWMGFLRGWYSGLSHSLWALSGSASPSAWLLLKDKSERVERRVGCMHGTATVGIPTHFLSFALNPSSLLLASTCRHVCSVLSHSLPPYGL